MILWCSDLAKSRTREAFHQALVDAVPGCRVVRVVKRRVALRQAASSFVKPLLDMSRFIPCDSKRLLARQGAPRPSVNFSLVGDLGDAAMIDCW